MADSEYIIEIAAQLPDGPTTIAELDRLTATLTGAGRRSDDFQAAMKRLGNDLDVAKTAAKAANDALALGSDNYRVLERDALKASKAVERAAAKGVVPDEIAKQAKAADIALAQYGFQLAALEKASKGADTEQARLAGHLDKVRKVAQHVDERNAKSIEKYGRLGQAAGLIPGPIGDIARASVRAGQAQAGLSATFGGSAIAALGAIAAVAALVAVVVAATVAAVAGAVAFVQYATSVGDTAREAAITREALGALSAETAAAVGSFDAVSAATGLADDRLADITKQLRAAKVSAEDMPAALRAAATAEAALGKGGAAEFLDRLRKNEAGVQDLADEIDAQLGGLAARRLRGLAAQSDKLGKLWRGLFDGINIEPVLDAVSILVGMFDKANPLAQAMGAAIQGAFSIVEKYAVAAAYAVEAFALGFAIELTKLYIAVKPALKWIAELFGFKDTSLRETLDAAVVAGKIFAGVFIVALGAIAVLVAAAAVAFAVFAAPVFVLVGAVSALVYGLVLLEGVLVSAVLGAFAAVTAFITETIPQWASLGADLIAGLVQGIIGGIGSVISAVTDTVGGAINAAKEALGIASPSKVFAEIGDMTVMGFTGALDAGTVDANASMSSLVTPDPAVSTAATSAGAAPAQAKGGAAPSAGIDLAGATFNFYGVENAEQARGRFAELLTMLLEEDADSLAGAVAPA